MIRAELFDCGMTLVLKPFGTPPGMDEGYYRELDFEYDVTYDRREAIRNEILNVQHPRTYRPWPEPFPGYMWIDWSRNNYATVEGPILNLHRRDDLFDEYPPVPSPQVEVQDEESPQYEPTIDTKDQRSSDLLSPEEILETVPDAVTSGPWIRQPLVNETGQPQLKNPMVMHVGGFIGSGFVPEVNYGPYYQAVDLREPDWYEFLDENGDGIDRELGYNLATLKEGGHYRLYLAPAKWRLACFVTAHYYYVSYFESFGVALDFIKAFITRPGMYPQRHDVGRTRYEDVVNWQGVDYSYDPGVEGAFTSSRASLALAQEIVDAQWYTLSEAFIFLFNDPVRCFLWQYPPDPGDIVLGVGRVDVATGEEQIVWVMQNRDVIDVYPRTVIGNFIIPWTVTT